MKQYNNYIILILLLFFFSSCVFEKYEDVRDDVSGYISLNITPMRVVQTKGTMYKEELLIKDAYLLLFDKDGKYFEGEALDLDLISGNGTTTPKIKTFTPADKYESIILINTGCGYGTDNIPLAKGVSTKDDISKYFTAETWHLNSSSKDFAVPMSGTISGTDTCQIRAAVAKVSLTFYSDAWAQTPYGKALSQTICNFPKYGNIYQENINNPFETFDYSKIIDKQKAGRTINNPPWYKTYFPYEYAFYIPEFPNAEYDYSGTKIDNTKYSNKRLCIVFQNTKNNKYYRVDFYDRNKGEFIDIIRNKHYKIYIDGNTHSGYNTFEEALYNTDGLKAASFYDIEVPSSYDITGYEKYTDLRKQVYAQSNGDYAIITNYDATFVSSKKQEEKKFLLSCMLTTPKSGKPKPNYKFELIYLSHDSMNNYNFGEYSIVPSDLLKIDIKENVPLNTTDNPKGLQTGFFKEKSDTLLTEKSYFDIYCTVLKDLDFNKYLYLKINYGEILVHIPIGKAKFSIKPNNIIIPSDGGKASINVESSFELGRGFHSSYYWSDEYFIGFEQIWEKSIGPETFDVKYELPQSEVPYFEKYEYAYWHGETNMQISSTSSNYNLSPHIVVEPYSAPTAELRAAEDINTLSGKERYNLSNQTNGGDNVENTANCYIINNSGKYKLPLVYGNAIKNGADNAGSYKTSNSSSIILSQFVNSYNNAITQPYIYGQQNPADACLVWQDMYNLVENIKLSADGRWLEFDVPKENISDGNALLAVRDASGNILWSWHIWVTNYKLGTNLKHLKINNKFNVTNNKTYEIMPLNLGQVEPYKYETGADSKCVIYFKQAITGLVDSVTVVRSGQKGDTENSKDWGKGFTYYSWGRKDPLHPRAGRHRYVEDEKYIEFPVSNQMLISQTLEKPYVRFGVGSGGCWIAGVNSSNYTNLWGSNYETYSHKGNEAITGNNPEDIDYKTPDIGRMNVENIKTVYDPCPVGFKIPPSLTFTSLAPDGYNFYAGYPQISGGYSTNDRLISGYPEAGSEYMVFMDDNGEMIDFLNVSLRTYDEYTPDGIFLRSHSSKYTASPPNGTKDLYIGEGFRVWTAQPYGQRTSSSFRCACGEPEMEPKGNNQYTDFRPFISGFGRDAIGAGQYTFGGVTLNGNSLYSFNMAGVRPVKED